MYFDEDLHAYVVVTMLDAIECLQDIRDTIILVFVTQ